MQPTPRTARVSSYVFLFFFNHFTVWNATQENDMYTDEKNFDFEIFTSKGTKGCGEIRDCLTSTTAKKHSLRFGVDFRIDLAGGMVRSIDWGWILGRDPPRRRNSCRGSSDSGGPRRAEWSELSSAIFSLEPKYPRTPLLTRSPRSSAPCCFPRSFVFVSLIHYGVYYRRGEEYGVIKGSLKVELISLLLSLYVFTIVRFFFLEF